MKATVIQNDAGLLAAVMALCPGREDGTYPKNTRAIAKPKTKTAIPKLISVGVYLFICFV